jgi:hypothetical protein
MIARLDIAVENDLDDDEVASSADAEADPALGQKRSDAPKFGSFADLFNAAQPTSNANKALVAGYWLQVYQSQDDFDAQSANKELKNLGEGIGNITIAASSLKSQKPALVIQLKKSGKSQQARKTYKVTVAGIRAVESMISGAK